MKYNVKKECWFHWKQQVCARNRFPNSRCFWRTCYRWRWWPWVL